VTQIAVLPSRDRVAALPMYDLPKLRPANDALWRAVAARLSDSGIDGVPAGLTRTRPIAALWRDPCLLLAQSCGYPLVTSLRGAVKLVATPRYRAPGCDGPVYRSAILVAASNPVASLAELRGSLCVANEPTSNSGVNLLRAAIAPLAGRRRFFRNVLWSGSHRASVAMIANGKADVAAIDCVTFELLRRTAPALVAAVRVLAWSEASPGLPLITAAATKEETVEILRAALADVASDPAVRPALDALLIEGFDTLASDAYEPVLALERDAGALGYPELA
jgi:ABC-type phosphate/phosphonate transport system substrate-binding protein